MSGNKQRNHSGLGKQKEVEIGTYAKFIGLGGEKYVCPECYRSFKRGFFVEQKTLNACTRNCLKKQIAKQA